MADRTEAAARIRSGTAVVTGAGAGLGRTLALRLAREGLNVAGIGRGKGPLDEVAAEVKMASQGRFEAIVADVADPAAVEVAFAGIAERLGPVTLLINNAAVYPRRDILDETPESFMATMAVNLGGPLACCHAVLPGMVETGIGRIINVVTFADLGPAPMAAAYSVSKGAQRILTRALVADLGDRFPGIVISDWIPGALRTGMGIPDGLDPAEAAEWGVRLALWHDPGLNGVTFDRETEVLEPKSLKRRLLERMLGQRLAPRKLGG